MYEKSAADATFALTEIPVYAMGRVATYKPLENLTTYEISDHLGSVRQVWKRSNTATTLTQENTYNYYPYGLGWSDNTEAISQRYGYQGQFSEKDKEATVTASDGTILSNQQSFELRDYNSITGQWDVVDPYEQYASSYLAMGNNPVSMVDPDGGKAGAPVAKGAGRRTTQKTSKHKSGGGKASKAVTTKTKTPAPTKTVTPANNTATNFSANVMANVFQNNREITERNLPQSAGGSTTPFRDFLSNHIPNDDHFTWPGPGKDLLLNVFTIEFSVFAIPFSAALSFANIINYATIGIAANDIVGNPDNIPMEVRYLTNISGFGAGLKGGLERYNSIFNNSIKVANFSGAGSSGYTLYDLGNPFRSEQKP